MHMQNKESAATRLHRRADTIQASALEDPHSPKGFKRRYEAPPSEAVSAMVSLAEMHCSRSHYEDAIRLLERAIDLEEKNSGRDSPSIAPILLALANALEDSGRGFEAQNARQRAADLMDYSVH